VAARNNRAHKLGALGCPGAPAYANSDRRTALRWYRFDEVASDISSGGFGMIQAPAPNQDLLHFIAD